MLDSKRGNKFVVKYSLGRVRVFVQSPSGLYYLDTNKARSSAVFVNFVDSVSNNDTKYSNCDYSNALLVLKYKGLSVVHQ